MLKRNSINVHSNTLHSSHWKFGACQEWGAAGRLDNFENVLNGFSKSPRLIVLNIDWVQLFSKMFEILHCPSSVW